MRFIKFDSLFEKFTVLVIFQMLYKSGILLLFS